MLNNLPPGSIEAADSDKDEKNWRTPFYAKLKQLTTDITVFRKESRGIKSPPKNVKKTVRPLVLFAQEC